MQQTTSSPSSSENQTQPLQEKGSSENAGSGIKESSFWVSQIFMLIATVMGVYLAAQEGLNQAIAFNDLTSKQNNYYLRNSLASELKSNIEQAGEYAEFVKRSSDNTIKRFPLQLDLFVWESMRYSSSTLETPAEFISEIQRYYREADDIRQKIERRVYSSEYGGTELQKITERMEKEILPKLQGNIEELKKTLAEKGVVVE